MKQRKIDILMLRSKFDNEMEESSREKFHKHYEVLKGLGHEIRDLGMNENTPQKKTILDEVIKMRGSDRIIYIDAKTELDPRTKKWGWVFDNKERLFFHELDEALGANRAHIIIRGEGSGVAVTTPVLAKLNRNIYTSNFINNENNPIDPYEIPGFDDFDDLHFKHEDQAKILRLQGQFTKKYIGIKETKWPETPKDFGLSPQE